MLTSIGEEGTKASAWDQKELQFTDSAPYGSAAQITRHFGYSVQMPDYDLKVEKFKVLIPEGYSTNGEWGLLVWISPENAGQVPEGLAAELRPRRLLLVSAYKSGNDRHPLDRFRLALDATCNMCRKYQVDRKRIYVGGFSGGGRMASMLGVAYGDIFTGTLCVCGVNFYRALRSPEGDEYIATYAPDPGACARAKQAGRFVLVTGETDPNRRNTKYLAEHGFRQEGFKNVMYLEVPGMGHAMPDVGVLKTALNYLEADTNRVKSSKVVSQ